MDIQLRQATPEDAEAVVLMQTQAHEACYPHRANTHLLGYADAGPGREGKEE
jgi:hypothetical protein